MISTHFSQPTQLAVGKLRLLDLLARQAADFIERKRTEQSLQTAKEQAEAANAAKDRFLAALSHELRTPLTPVLMTASAYKDSPELSQTLKDDFAMIHRNMLTEVELINDLLDVARIVQGRFELSTRACDVHGIIATAVAMVRQEIESKGITLALDCEAQPAFVLCDPTRLQQVIWNLLRNAAKFTPPNGRISVHSFEVDEELRISVADTGVGLKQKDLARIFQAFEQAHPTRRSQMGLGLGLAISANIMSAHKGRIWAESAGEGKGAIFHLSLPTTRKEASSAKDEIPASSGAPPGGGIHILVVEDNDSTRETLVRLLSRRGYRAVAANSLAGARAFAGNRFDLAICDLGLPDGDGHQLLRQLQQRQELPAIALSGYGMDEDISQSLASGFAAHLVKPVTIDSLEAAMQEVLKKRPTALAAPTT